MIGKFIEKHLYLVGSEPRRMVTTNAIRNSFLALGESEDTRAFAAGSLQINEEASFDGHNVAEIATALGLAY